METVRSFLVLFGILGVAPLIGLLVGVGTKEERVVLLAGITLALGVGLVSVIWIAGLIARTNRIVLVVVFPPLLVITNVGLVVLTALNGGVLTYAFGEQVPGAAAICAIATAFGVVVMAYRALSLPIGRIGKGESAGVLVTEEQAPRLWEEVREVAKSVGTAPPKNILLGLDLNFYATEQPRVLLGPVDERRYVERRLAEGEEETRKDAPLIKGRTMYLSLPLSRIMTVGELKAVIAHELAHFRGWDTKFTRVFYPVWRSAVDSLMQLSEALGISIFSSLPIIPAYSVLSVFLTSFSEAEARLSRERELAADRASLKATDDRTTATALVKIHGFSRYGRRTQALMRDKIAAADPDMNVVDLYVAAAEENKTSVWMRRDLDEEEPPHPTDSHPPLSLRLAQLKLSLKDVEEGAFTVRPETPATSLLDRPEEIEALMTQAEKRRMIANNEVREGSKKEIWQPAV